ncbi:DNA-binding response regulator [Pseudomaricurvus sp. HS19]|nr:DNA-binding response regulator [Pseudomaricurvus sp. HS19]
MMVFVALVALASGGDMLADLAHGADRAHLLQEGLLLALALMILLWLWRDHRSQRRALVALQQELEQIRSRPEPESAQVLSVRQHFSAAINDQFGRWQLTPSEAEVGLMLLKGYSLKEVAMLRGTAERTIRQQASAIYQKSGVSGRHSFAAWFLEDLLTPQ